MGILESFRKERETPQKKDRRAKKVYGEGNAEQRRKKQRINRGSLINGTSFIIIVKSFAFLLGLALVALIGYAVYLGIDIFIS